MTSHMQAVSQAIRGADRWLSTSSSCWRVVRLRGSAPAVVIPEKWEILPMLGANQHLLPAGLLRNVLLSDVYAHEVHRAIEHIVK
jgi:hypothetical protein